MEASMKSGRGWPKGAYSSIRTVDLVRGLVGGCDGRPDVDTNAVRRSAGVPWEERKGVEDVKAVEDMIDVTGGC